MKNQSSLNKFITDYFNSIIGTIQNPELIGLNPNERPFKKIIGLNYNSSTDTVLIEMEELIYILTVNSDDTYILKEYEKV